MKTIVRIRNVLADVCGWLAEFFEECSRRLAACEKCGRSVFYGEPCVGEDGKYIMGEDGKWS